MTVARTYPRWPFIAVFAIVAAIAGASLAIFGSGAEAALHATRYMARFSFLIFVTVFATGALAALFPSDATRWLRRNRRRSASPPG
jgi:peptidoglycan/LPS O-acetylase OafA/YrhL